jgi:hypothetical protein
MAHVPEIRASDAERERVATELREHAAEGRLDVDELDERLEQAYAARTRGDLERLTADLPAAPPPKAPSPTVPERGWGLAERAGSYVGVLVIVIIIWAVTGAGYPWFIWPAIGWGLALVTTGKTGLPWGGPRRRR